MHPTLATHLYSAGRLHSGSCVPRGEGYWAMPPSHSPKIQNSILKIDKIIYKSFCLLYVWKTMRHPNIHCTNAPSGAGNGHFLRSEGSILSKNSLRRSAPTNGGAPLKYSRLDGIPGTKILGTPLIVLYFHDFDDQMICIIDHRWVCILVPHNFFIYFV